MDAPEEKAQKRHALAMSCAIHYHNSPACKCEIAVDGVALAAEILWTDKARFQSDIDFSLAWTSLLLFMCVVKSLIFSLH
jgi:hypothetical protein